MTVIAILERRGLVAVGGEDRHTFLHGLLTADLAPVKAGGAAYTLMLTAQGRFVHDAFVVEHQGAVWLETAAERADALVSRLKPYRLRARVGIAPVAEPYVVGALPDAPDTGVTPDAPDTGAEAVPEASDLAGGLAHWQSAAAAHGGVAFADPRLPAMGVRFWLPEARLSDFLATTGAVTGPAEAYHRARIGQGIAEGDDLEPERSLPLDYGIDRLNAIGWKKGCYLGQEVTARMHYRGLAKRGLVAVTLGGPRGGGLSGPSASGSSAPGRPVIAGDPVMMVEDGRGEGTPAAGEVGALCSVSGDRALMLIRRDLIAPWQAGVVGLDSRGTRLWPLAVISETGN